MGVNKEEISKTIIELEKSFNERWSAGDNRGYLDNYAEEVSYFDPVLKEVIVGRDKVITHMDRLHLLRPAHRAQRVPQPAGSRQRRR